MAAGAEPAAYSKEKSMALRTIVALDPGPTQTGYVVYDGARVLDSGIEKNRDVLRWLKARSPEWCEELAIEMIASYGMAVGREVFETCVWVGRYMQAWHCPDGARLILRSKVKLHLCKSSKAKDANIRAALIDLFPATGGGKTPQIGTVKQPGPLFGVSSHIWAALAVAVTAMETDAGMQPVGAAVAELP